MMQNAASLAMTRLTVREDGRVEVRLSISFLGCVVSLRSHGRTGDTRHITIGASWETRPLCMALVQLLQLEKSHALALIRFGAIYLAGTRAESPEAEVDAGMYLRAHLEPKQVVMPHHISVLEENDNFVVRHQSSPTPHPE